MLLNRDVLGFKLFARIAPVRLQLVESTLQAFSGRGLLIEVGVEVLLRLRLDNTGNHDVFRLLFDGLRNWADPRHLVEFRIFNYFLMRILQGLSVGEDPQILNRIGLGAHVAVIHFLRLRKHRGRLQVFLLLNFRDAEAALVLLLERSCLQLICP